MKVHSAEPFDAVSNYGVKALLKIIIQRKDGYKLSAVYFDRYFTGNCQLGALSYVNNFLENVSSDKDITELFASLRVHLADKYPPQFLFDVRNNLAQLVRDYFQVVVDAPYVSTNGSNMVLFIVKAPK
jgi:hypothetical protein